MGVGEGWVVTLIFRIHEILAGNVPANRPRNQPKSKPKLSANIASRRQPLEVDPPDVTKIVFHNEQVALVIHRYGAQLAELIAGRVEPPAVTGMRVAISIDHDVDHAGYVHVEKLGATIGGQEVAADW